jgi:hypothetical protein
VTVSGVAVAVISFSTTWAVPTIFPMTFIATDDFVTDFSKTSFTASLDENPAFIIVHVNDIVISAKVASAA